MILVYSCGRYTRHRSVILPVGYQVIFGEKKKKLMVIDSVVFFLSNNKICYGSHIVFYNNGYNIRNEFFQSEIRYLSGAFPSNCQNEKKNNNNVTRISI